MRSGPPVLHPDELTKTAFSNCAPPPTGNRSDATAFLRQAIDTERDAIGFYHKLADRVWDKDPVTSLLVTGILKAEVEDEGKYERYLGKA